MPNDIDFKLLKVLLVDDDKTVHRLFRKFQENLGFTAAYAFNGQEAVDIISTYNFDLCFMDLMMPHMDGIEAAFIIKEKISPDLPIVAITSSTMNSTRENCRDVGMCDYLVKPFDLKSIELKIRQYGRKGCYNFNIDSEACQTCPKPKIEPNKEPSI